MATAQKHKQRSHYSYHQQKPFTAFRQNASRVENTAYNKSRIEKFLELLFKKEK